MNHKQAKKNAVVAARSKIDLRPIYIDTETTGLGYQDEVIELSIIDHNGKTLLDSLIKPTIKIQKDATRVHNITNAMVNDAPSLHDMWAQAKEIIDNQAIGIYNAEYDVRLIKQSLHKHGLQVPSSLSKAFCIMKLYASYYGDWSDHHHSYTWQSLEKAASQSEISLKNTHRAMDDALLARAVLFKIAGLPTHEENEESQKSALIPSDVSPEEAELERKKLHLAQLEEELITRELELATLQSRLHSFQRIYIETVGALFAQLDDLQAQIDEMIAISFPEDGPTKGKAERSRSRAEETQQAYEKSLDEVKKPRMLPSESLKKLFRRVAKEIHPDLSETEEERELREEWMKRANAAFQLGDAQELQKILDEWKHSPLRIPKKQIGAELIRVIRKIAIIDNRLEEIQSEIVRVESSDLHNLMERVELGKTEDRDVLEELAERLNNQITRSQQRLNQLVSGGGS